MMLLRFAKYSAVYLEAYVRTLPPEQQRKLWQWAA